MKLNKGSLTHYIRNTLSYLSRTVFILLISSGLHSCGIYSFTGTTLSPDIKTIGVGTFQNNSGNGPANLSQLVTDRIKEYYQQNSTLKIVPLDANADLYLDGAIVGYETSPIAPRENDFAALNRLTIRVQAKFINTKDETQNFDTSFSFYDDFPQERTLTQEEGRLIPTIMDQIVFDIFNKSVANW